MSLCSATKRSNEGSFDDDDDGTDAVDEAEASLTVHTAEEAEASLLIAGVETVEEDGSDKERGGESSDTATEAESEAVSGTATDGTGADTGAETGRGSGSGSTVSVTSCGVGAASTTLPS